MNDATHGASRIKTLRLAVRPGASAITQLAAALIRHGASPRRVASPWPAFSSLMMPGFPVLAYPGRKSVAPVFARRPSFR